ncbi:MAG: hypothetical protein LBI27_08215 [Clostridiales bacterium]|jgi:hypothetical protein|nr:hypothetical protein [Clostridiales bacterium]
MSRLIKNLIIILLVLFSFSACGIISDVFEELSTITEKGVDDDGEYFEGTWEHGELLEEYTGTRKHLLPLSPKTR